MAVCVNCGTETDGYLCSQCSSSVDLENLCGTILEYKIGSGENPLWDQIASGLSNMYNFRNVIFAIADELPSPRREYWKILSLSGMNANVPKDSRPWLYEINKQISGMEGLTGMEKNRIKGIVLGALFMDYQYEAADNLAGELLEEEELPRQAYYNLADFYSKTRRYDEADDAMDAAEKLYGIKKEILFGEVFEKNQKYREAEANGNRQYIPNPKENKETVRKAYIDYLASIGIEAELTAPPKRKEPVAIPKDQYPSPKEIRDPDFDSFVAYDLETTGKHSKTDAIIEIGAVKVSGGEVIESREFTFQEFVRPYKKRISEEVTNLTGITNDDVKNARQMWEVFPDFMDFVGDNVLVGFNNVAFDSAFLVRAGRYSNLIMNNPQFDVMRYADKFREKMGITDTGIKLGTLCSSLGIDNPRAHRALADAITTARVFLKLREMDSLEKNVVVDDLLSDLDSW